MKGHLMAIIIILFQIRISAHTDQGSMLQIVYSCNQLMFVIR